jgi:hypothetical protein
MRYVSCNQAYLAKFLSTHGTHMSYHPAFNLTNHTLLSIWEIKDDVKELHNCVQLIRTPHLSVVYIAVICKSRLYVVRQLVVVKDELQIRVQ